MKFLFLTEKFYPSPLANGVCLQKIADVLKIQGHEINILAYKDSKIDPIEKYNDMKVYYVVPDLRTRLFYYARNYPDAKFAGTAFTLAKVLNRIKKFIFVPFYPLYSLFSPLRILNKITKLNEKENYDAIICVYSPFETTLAQMWFKRKNQKIFSCLYTVDSFANDRHDFLKKKGNNIYWLPKILNVNDLFLYMRSREKEYSESRFDIWKEKMVATDIPLMSTRNILPVSKDKKKEDWIYAGSLGEPHYIVDDIINIFLGLDKSKERILHFYSFGPELNKIKQICKLTNGSIRVHNYVSQEELKEIYSNADVLVSMKYSDQISAKVFEYMSFGKKMVHVSGTKLDPDTEYISHYEKGIILRPYSDSIEDCIVQLNNWLTSWDDEKEGMKVDYSYFEMNRPEYTANIILDYLNQFKKRITEKICEE